MAGTDFNFSSEHVQSEIENGEFISSEATVLLAGPSRLSYIDAAKNAGSTTSSLLPLYPIGLIGDFRIDQRRDVERLYEIGSKRAYFITGRNRPDFAMSRTLFYGPSLMRMLYALAPVRDRGMWGTGIKDNEGKSPVSKDYEALFGDDLDSFVPPGAGGLLSEDQNRDFWTSLTSEVFSIPFGLGILYKDSKNRPYAANYLEDAFISSHSMSISMQSVIMAEGISGSFDRLSPFQAIVSS